MAEFERLSAAISHADLHRRHGRVSDLIGLIVEATGLEAEVGEVCEIATGRSRAAVPRDMEPVSTNGSSVGLESAFVLRRAAGWRALRGPPDRRCGARRVRVSAQ